MRVLTSKELISVAGGQMRPGQVIPNPGGGFTVNVRGGRRIESWDTLWRWGLYEQDGGGSELVGDDGGGGGGGVIGHPVDLDPSSIKDARDYEKDWEAVFDKMSPAELKAFDAQLERDYKNAMDKLNFGLAGFLLGFKDANGNPGKMGMASSYAAQNASPFTLGLLEAALTRAYAVAAALPGGI